MATIISNPSRKKREWLADELKEGKTAILPTETCYGIHTDALNEEAVERVYEMKKRPKSKNLICVVCSLKQAEKYCDLKPVEERLCNCFMPGPLTLVAEKKEIVPDVVNDKFVFRIPAHDLVRSLARLVGDPLVSTSANVSGGPNPYAVEEIPEKIRREADFLVDQGRLPKNHASTVAEIDDKDLVIHRKGAVPVRQIKTFFENGAFG